MNRIGPNPSGLIWALVYRFATNRTLSHSTIVHFVCSTRITRSSPHVDLPFQDRAMSGPISHTQFPYPCDNDARCAMRRCGMGLLICLTIVLLLIPNFSQLLAQNSPVVSGPGALLMKHGDVIVGELSPMGDQIAVRLDADNQIFLPVRQIDHIAGSVEEIYQFKIRKYGHLGTGEHYQMAGWCLKNKLNDQAIQHYQELKRLAPNDPSVKRLAFQLKETILQEPWAKEVIRQQQQVARPANPTLPNGVVTAGTSGSSNSTVQTAGGSAAAASSSVINAGGATSPPQSIPRNGQQPQALSPANVNSKPMPFEPVISEDSTRLFRSHLQPILIQKCGQSGCHGAQASNNLKLHRPSANSTKKTAENNIASLSAFIDTPDASKTRLYQFATKPHGSQKVGSLGQVDNDGSDELLGWLKLISYQTLQGQMMPGVMGGMPVDANGFPLSPNATGGTQLWQQHLDKMPGGAGGAAANSNRPNLNDPPVVSVQQFNSAIQQPFNPDIANEITASELDKLDEEVRRAEAAEKGEQLPQNPPPSSDPFDPNAFNNQFRKPE